MAIECDERERWQNYTQIINREEQSKIKEKSKREDHFYFLNKHSLEYPKEVLILFWGPSRVGF